MNLFEKYEKLKNSNEIIPIGSVWSSGIYMWEVRSLKTEDDFHNEFVLVRNINRKLTIYAGDIPFKKDVFKRHFKRIK